jgi:hypothetical protein
MPQRFEPSYKVTRGDNLGDPEFWNRRFQDVDLRLASRESDAENLARAADILLAVGLQRLNDTFTPLILEARTQLANFGVLFTAVSDSNVTIGLGEKSFVLSEDSGPAFVFTDYAYARATGDETAGVVGRVLSYDKEARLLTLDVVLVDGTGTFDSWDIGPSVKPDTVHATRTDNPHQTTAAQVGSYTTEQVDAFISGIDLALALLAPKNSPVFTGAPQGPTPPSNENSARFATTGWAVNYVNARIAEIVGAAPGSLDTLAELAAALNANPAQIDDILTALSNRLRFDAADVLDTTERTRLFDNLSLVTAVKSLLAAADQAGMRTAMGLGSAATHAHAEYQPAGNYQIAGNYANGVFHNFTGGIHAAGVLTTTALYFENTSLLIQFRGDLGALYTPNGWYVDNNIHATGGISCGGVKSFKIPHPTQAQHDLVHVCLEGPEAAVFYRGKGRLTNGVARIELPRYFTALVDEASITVGVTPIWENGRAGDLAPEPVVDGVLVVHARNAECPDDQLFDWRVEATRTDVPPLEVEPVSTGTI